jgi:hypothetical protein
MFGTQTTHRSPNFGLTTDQASFFQNAAKEHVNDIASLIPDAMQAVKFAAGILGVLAIGCAVVQQQKQ